MSTVTPPRLPDLPADVQKSSAWSRLPSVGRILLGATLAACFLLSGYALGHQSGGEASWHTGSAQVFCCQEVGIQTDDWTYDIVKSVGWIDAAGSTHQDGWPKCLDVPVSSVIPVRFAAVEVDVDGQAWREVVMVDCRAR